MSKVLIVDDYKDATETLALIVRSWGFDCRTVYDGPSAVELAATYEPDAVLLDLGMPEVDGWEVATRLRNLPHHALILAVSGYGRKEDVDRCRDAGMDGHFLKPIDPLKLRSVLSERLQATRSKRRSARYFRARTSALFLVSEFGNQGKPQKVANRPKDSLGHEFRNFNLFADLVHFQR